MQGRENKAVYTTASVTYGKAGAVMPYKQLLGKNFNSMTDQWTDGWMVGRTDGWTDEQTDRQTDGWTEGRTDGWMDGRTENLSILQDFVPYQGSCPASQRKF